MFVYKSSFKNSVPSLYIPIYSGNYISSPLSSPYIFREKSLSGFLAALLRSWKAVAKGSSGVWSREVHLECVSTLSSKPKNWKISPKNSANHPSSFLVPPVPPKLEGHPDHTLHLEVAASLA